MQLYAARFASTLDDWIPRLPSPNDRVLNECFVSYFYKGRTRTTENVSQSLSRWPCQRCVWPVQNSLHRIRGKDDQSWDYKFSPSGPPLPLQATTATNPLEFRQPLGGERRAKNTDSAGTKIVALSGDSLLAIFDCDNCGGTHKSMNCKSTCRLCKSRVDDNHILFHCPKISNAVERKKTQLPRRDTGPSQRSVKSESSGSKRTGGSVVSVLTQDDSEVSDYPVYVDTCASDITLHWSPISMLVPYSL